MAAKAKAKPTMPRPYSAKKPVPATYKGKSTKPGGGGMFQMQVDAMTKKGLPPAEAAAVAAKMGRKKYGKAKFAKMGVAGKKRAMKARKKKGK